MSTSSDLKSKLAATKAKMNAAVDGESAPKAKKAAKAKPVEESEDSTPVAAPKAKKVGAPKKTAAPKVESEEVKVKAPKVKKHNPMASIIDALSSAKGLAKAQRKLFIEALSDDADLHKAASDVATALQAITLQRTGSSAIVKLQDALRDHLVSFDLGVVYEQYKIKNSKHFTATEKTLVESLAGLADGFTTRDNLAVLIKLLTKLDFITTKAQAGGLPHAKVLVLDKSWSFLDDTITNMNNTRKTGKPIARDGILSRVLVTVFIAMSEGASDEELADGTAEENVTNDANLLQISIDHLDKGEESNGNGAAEE